MRAVVFAGVGRVEVREVPEPSLLEPDDAIVRVTLTGICGSDLHFLHGKAPLEPGEQIGHEAVGIVERVGEAVETVKQGDRVVVSFDIACGVCWFCRKGQTQLCERSGILGAGAFGGDLAGTQAERVRVPVADVNLLVLPDDVDDEAALFVGDVLSTAVAVADLAEPSPGDAVAVIGCGPVGFLTVQALRAGDLERVLVLERQADRLHLAASVGAQPIDVTARHPQSAVDEATGGRGADVVVECVGHPDAFETAIDVVRRGGRVVVAGMYAGETIEAQLGSWWIRALELRFSGMCPVHAYWERALGELVAGRIDPRPLISHRLPLSAAQQAYRLFDTREATKVVLRP
ncbi:MAG: alcohol dehydrogenase catalytic domain-containing protein [Actinomycetota bacterium]